jgi:anthranilate phosphoribosyltransferase
MVVCGADGMDEISFAGDTYVAELKDGKVTEYIVNPQQFGLDLHNVSAIKVASALESKAMLLDVLSGKKGAARDIVLLNAGAAIYVAGLTPSLQAGIHHAAQMLDNGKALQKLQELVALTHA